MADYDFLNSSEIAAKEGGYRTINRLIPAMAALVNRIVDDGRRISGRKFDGFFIYRPFNTGKKFPEVCTTFSPKQTTDEKFGKRNIYCGISVFALNAVLKDEKLYTFLLTAYLFEISKLLQWKYDILSGHYFLNLLGILHNYKDLDIKNEERGISYDKNRSYRENA